MALIRKQQPVHKEILTPQSQISVCFYPKYFNIAHVFLIIKVMPHIIIDNRILKLPLKG